jgi:hypothetical protein
MSCNLARKKSARRLAVARGEAHIAGMPFSPHHFACPLCDAEFKLVLVEAGPESTDGNVECPACATELPGRAPGKVLKYFLVAEPG